MKYLHLVLAVMLLGMLGCSDEGVVAVDADEGLYASDVAAAKHTVKMVPFKGSLDWQIVGTGDPGCVPERPPEETIEAIIFSEGQLTHLGRSTSVLTNCNDVTGVPYPLFGEAVITAANEDQLFSEVTYPSPPFPEGCDFTIAQEITGGTGRFDGVTGTVDVCGTYGDATESFGTVVLEGWISSVGSSK